MGENETLTTDDLLPWLRKVDRLVLYAAAFNDEVGEKMLKTHLEAVGDMYKLVTGELSPHLVKGER